MAVIIALALIIFVVMLAFENEEVYSAEEMELPLARSMVYLSMRQRLNHASNNRKTNTSARVMEAVRECVSKPLSRSGARK